MRFLGIVKKRMSSRQAVKTVAVPVSTTWTMSEVQSDNVVSENDFVRTRRSCHGIKSQLSISIYSDINSR